jgi:hypothetical protein
MEPNWKSGPTYPEPTSSEHAIDRQPAGYDFDGVRVREAERVDGEPLLAIREAYSCRRDGCEADPSKAHVYALSDVSARTLQIARYAHPFDQPLTDEIVEFLAMNAEIMDYDEGPIIAFEIGDRLVGYAYPHFTDHHDFDGPCYGRVEPEPDVHAHKYDDI